MSNSITPFRNLPVEITEMILKRAIDSDPSKSLSCFLAFLKTSKNWNGICENMLSLACHSIKIGSSKSDFLSLVASRLSGNFQEKINQIKTRQAFAIDLSTSHIDVPAYRKEKIAELGLFQENKRNCVHTLDVSKLDFSFDELMQTVSRLPNLQSLTINVKRLWIWKELNDKTFELLIEKCPNLISLKLENSHLSIQAFTQLDRFCPRLQEIDLNHSEQIDGNVFQILFNLPDLKKIDLSYGKKIDDRLIKTCPNSSLKWEELNISHCTHPFSEESLSKLSDLYSNLKIINLNEEDWE